MLSAYKLATTISATLGVALIMMQSSRAASFQYTTLTTKSVYTEDPTVIAGAPYDGVFVNNIFNPFLGLEQTFFGFYRVQTGELGEAVSLRAVQQRPTNRTEFGEDGLTRIEYLATPQTVDAVPGAFAIPPGLTEFDFKFVPAAVANAPVVLSKGWTAKPTPESNNPLALVCVLGLGLGLKRASSATAES